MKKLYTFLFAVAVTATLHGQITVSDAIVPQNIQGVNGTNNARTPFYAWIELSGLTPGATYRYYTMVDTIGSSPTSNGAGNPYLVNTGSGTVRRTTSASLSNSAGHDSLTATNGGTYAGWFGVEPTGNGRFTPGTQVHLQFNMNDGAGGTSTANRVKDTANMITVIDYGTNVAATEGSALFDSASTFNIAPKDFVFLYDNNSAAGRPLSSAIVEDEGIDQSTITSIALFYRDSVNAMMNYWGTIIPNMNANGVRAVEYRAFATGQVVDTQTDNNGTWCSGAETVNPVNGSTGLFLHEYFSLSGVAIIPDTAYTTIGVQFFVTTNGSPSTVFTWDFGDGSPFDNTQNPTHIYLVPGMYNVTVIIQDPNCGIALSDSIEVILFTGIQSSTENSFFTVYPNPSAGNFIVKTNGTGLKTVSVLNMLGEVVYTAQTSSDAVPVSVNVAPGIYLVRVTDEDGTSTTEKVVIE